MRKPSAEKQHSIIISALKLYGSYENFSIDRICDSAGVGKGTFYTFYLDKDELQQEVRNYVSKRCWNDLIAYLTVHDEKDFSVKVGKTTDYIVSYVKNQRDFRNATAGIAAWPYQAEDLLALSGDGKKIISDPLLHYASGHGTDPGEVAVNFLFLTRCAVLAAYTESRTAAPDYDRVKKDLRMTASRLVVPEAGR